jgi:hypothetical protein
MAALENFIDHIWQQVGPACRKHVRESWEIIEQAKPEDRPKLLATFYWTNWCRGRRDLASGRETSWDMPRPRLPASWDP